MIAIFIFAVMALVSLFICHFYGSPEPDELNGYDLIFSPIFGIAFVGLIISVLYQFLKLFGAFV